MSGDSRCSNASTLHIKGNPDSGGGEVSWSLPPIATGCLALLALPLRSTLRRRLVWGVIDRPDFTLIVGFYRPVGCTSKLIAQNVLSANSGNESPIVFLL